MNKIKDEMMKRYIKETSCRGINNNLRKDNADNIKKHQLEIFQHKKAEKNENQRRQKENSRRNLNCRERTLFGEIEKV